MMRMPLTDAHIRLLRGVRGVIAADPMLASWMAGETGPALVIEDFASQPWASLTFSGTRHSLSIRLEGPADLVAAGRARLGVLLHEPDLALGGHFLAELTLEDRPDDGDGFETGGRQGHARLAIQLEALTIEE